MAFFANKVFRRNFHVIEKDFGGGVVHHGANWADRQPMILGVAQIDQQNRESFTALLYLFNWSSACDQQHQVRMLGARNPDFLTFDYIGVANAASKGLHLRGIGARGRLAHAESLKSKLPACQRW